MHRYVLRYHGTELRLKDGASVVIGRDSTCDIRVEDKAASRRHARLRVTVEGVWLEDLKSRNGVYIDGTRVTEPRCLSAGAAFRLGQSRFSLRLASESEPAEDTSVGDPDKPITGSRGIAIQTSVTAPLPSMSPLDPILTRVDNGRAMLRDKARPLRDRFGSALAMVQELIDASADANARLLFGEALDALLQEKAAGVLPSSTVARAHAYIGRWSMQVQNSAAWDARRSALERAEKR